MKNLFLVLIVLISKSATASTLDVAFKYLGSGAQILTGTDENKSFCEALDDRTRYNVENSNGKITNCDVKK